jgi:hypothetical protein
MAESELTALEQAEHILSISGRGAARKKDADTVAIVVAKKTALMTKGLPDKAGRAARIAYLAGARITDIAGRVIGDAKTQLEDPQVRKTLITAVVGTTVTMSLFRAANKK